ncbi:M23 family metallopeptidase [Photobacterium halotolerans]|uniref:Peptidoglycan DD-metalloendopeptidase family protein n=1 Tax=Photobacterium halotolerans TaxID=265726 RepID=A0A7X4W7V7_9GAMM|nr:M23 family metallopeptidase [Photobacterium halotolerans]NAW63734.1 peptidoglycan DD-metalloendopeptidase family protein [Photobacterium halotolerans]
MKKSIALVALPFIASSVALAHDLYPAVPSSPVSQHIIDQGRDVQPLVSDADFVFRPYQAPFDDQMFFDSTAPNWLSLQETLMHWSGATGVDPRVILVTVLLTEDWQPDADFNQAQDMRLKEAIKRVANHLSQYFYRYEADDTVLPTNAATLAVLSTLNDPQRAAEWSQHYVAWFGESAPTRQSRAQSRAVSTLAPPAGFMQMPWRQGYNWVPNGPHAHSGSGFPLSSIDVSYDWPAWGGATYSVTAAHDGYATVLSRCQVRVTNQNGWATNYYHMDGVQVSNGQWVTKNTKLGTYANNRSTALCEGGSSTGPHLHFSLLYQGRFQSMQGTSFGPYQVQTGRYSYDDNCSYTWLVDQRSNQKVCFWRRIDNPVM